MPAESAPQPWRWTRRNVDKPHRCPHCHRVALRAWSRAGYGPRTILRCEYGCRVRWRVGTRTASYSYRFRQTLDQAGISWATTRRSNRRGYSGRGARRGHDDQTS